MKAFTILNTAIVVLMLILLFNFGVIAQNKSTVRQNDNTLTGSSQTQHMVAAIDSFNTVVPKEKVFVQTDRLFYTNNDTIWLKAYVLDADLNYSKQSGLLYTELIDDTGKVVLRASMPVRDGISFSQLILDDKAVPGSGYTLRAYTNWMQNQGSAALFTQRMYISAVGKDGWLIGSNTRLTAKNGQDKLAVSLQLDKADTKTPALLQSFDMKVMNGSKVLQSDHMQNDMGGKLAFNFNLPDLKLPSLRVLLINADKNSSHQKLVVPLEIDRPENIDLQFMPEGGKMVVGLPNVIGFKAIGEDGKGTDVTGSISDSKGNIVTSFKSAHLGMGLFTLRPLPGESYTACLSGSNKTYPLPASMASGIILHVINPADKDSVLMRVMASDDIINSGQVFSLIAISGDKVCYAANLPLAIGMVRGAVSKSRFRSGIVHFVVFDGKHQPVAERLIFIDHNDRLKIQVTPERQDYHPHDSIAMHISVTGQDGNPVQGSFSLAITDDKQVKADSSTLPDINSYMLLTGDLKGNIENPGYYFDIKNTDRFEAVDNLLLTQGWLGYDWKNTFDKNYRPAYRPETELAVTGKVSRTGGKAINGLQVVLLSPAKPVLVRDEVTDINGRFAFRNLPRIDTGNFLVQVKDKKGRIFEAMVNVDEFQPASTFGLDNSLMQPWYVNTDTTLFRDIYNRIAYNKIQEIGKLPPGAHVLKEVKITSVKSIKGSHNLNGPGQADQVLDEEDMKKAGKQTVMDIVSKIKGFNIFIFNGLETFKIYDKALKVVFDGIDLDFYHSSATGEAPLYEGFRELFNQYSAEDIKGIEVLYSDNYNGKYTTGYNSEIAAFTPRSQWPAYLEITTWSGNGLFEKRKSGNYIYRPLPISWPKQFYKPKYKAKTTNVLADLRPTVLWEPNIITDTAGKATVWFFAKSIVTNYTGIINGSNLNGSVGSAKINITVK